MLPMMRREVDKRDADVKLVALRNHLKPRRAAAGRQQLFPRGEDQFDIELGGHGKHVGADAAKSAGPEVFGERFDGLDAAGSEDPNRMVGPNSRRASALLEHQESPAVTLPPITFNVKVIITPLTGQLKG